MQSCGLAGALFSVGTGIILTGTILVFTVPHPAALLTCARKYIAAFTGQNVYGEVFAPAIFVHVIPFGEDCHWIFPLLPVSVNVTQLPWHTVAGETLAVPAVGGGSTVTVTVAGGAP